MSMSALWRLRALARSSGSAELLIATDLGSLPWSWSASILVIFPPETVTRTCALPYWVGSTSPVAVRVLAAVAVLVAAGVLVAVTAGAAVRDAAADSDGWCGLKLRTAARPAAVAVRTIGARRIGQKAKDSWWMWSSGTPAARAVAVTVEVKPSGPQTYTSRSWR